MDYNKFTFLDLFAGIGGFRRATEAFGGVSVGFSEIAKDVLLKKNYRKITKVEACKLQGFPEDFILPTAGQNGCISSGIAYR